MPPFCSRALAEAAPRPLLTRLQLEGGLHRALTASFARDMAAAEQGLGSDADANGARGALMERLINENRAAAAMAQDRVRVRPESSGCFW